MTSSQFKKKYHDYLKTDSWRKKRKKVLIRDNWTCQKCHEQRASDIHHLTYVRIFRERMEDLMAVCRKCHEELHGIERASVFKQSTDPIKGKIYNDKNDYFSNGDLITIEPHGLGEIVGVRNLDESTDILVKFFHERGDNILWFNTKTMSPDLDEDFWDRVQMKAFEAMEKAMIGVA